MKRLLLSVFVMSLLVFSACKEKEQPTPEPPDNNPANAFVGEYTVSADAVLVLPMVGEYPMTIPDMDGSVEKVGNYGDVKLNIFGQTLDAYVRGDGMHVDPFIINQEIYGISMAVTVAFPVIKAPVDGVITTTATLSATTSLGSVNGTADVVAVRK